MILVVDFSLFGLNYLKLLDLSYNRLSFLPKGIRNLRYVLFSFYHRNFQLPFDLYVDPRYLSRSLRELSVEGNELGALPTGILQLGLKHLRIMNNFTHPLFWRETTSNQPQVGITFLSE